MRREGMIDHQALSQKGNARQIADAYRAADGLQTLDVPSLLPLVLDRTRYPQDRKAAAKLARVLRVWARRRRPTGEHLDGSIPDRKQYPTAQDPTGQQPDHRDLWAYRYQRRQRHSSCLH